MKTEKISTNVQSHTLKITLAAVYVAIAVAGSTFSVPVFGSRCSPAQHLINIICAVTLGPAWAVAAAFCASLIRNLMGIGTLFAFPGSMFGALLAGLLYKYFKKLLAAYLGEVFGTAVLGGLTAYPVAAYVLHIKGAALFAYIFPFFISTAGGTLAAVVILFAMDKSGILKRISIEKHDI